MSIARLCPYSEEKENCKYEKYWFHPRFDKCSTCNRMKKEPTEGVTVFKKELGYNEANEWHYPSKGEYPKENKRYLCKIKTFVGGDITYECFDYDTEYSSWKDASGDVIAWKEIVLPKE